MINYSQKEGIETDQIGKGKTGRVKAIELTMKVATILVPLTEVLSIYRNASLLSGEEKMDFTVFTREESEELFEMCIRDRRAASVGAKRVPLGLSTPRIACALAAFAAFV